LKKKILFLENPREFVTIIKTEFLAAMVTPGGGENDISEEFKWHFAMFTCLMPDSVFIERFALQLLTIGLFQEENFNSSNRNQEENCSSSKRCFQIIPDSFNSK
jgi:hypothetical protein